MLKQTLRSMMQNHPSIYSLRQHWGAWPAVWAGTSGGQRSWSQHGEDDRLVGELQDQLQAGFYVDVGANHPVELSNTYRLYCQGMRGLCIEPSALLCRFHRAYRKDDTVLCGAVGQEDRLLTLYEMYPHTFSTFSRERRDGYLRDGMRCLRESLVPMFRLSTILACYTPENRPTFSLLSVDTEGFDEIVLRSNDWTRYRPRLVIAEGDDPEAARNIAAFLASVGYTPLVSFGINVIYHDTQAGQGAKA